MNDEPSETSATALLQRMREGDERAAEQFYLVVYDELRRLASAQMRGSAAGATLQPTALVHEAWLRLVGSEGAGWESRDHFLAVAARAMRHTLVDSIRRRMSTKRGGEYKRVPFEDLLDLHEQRSGGLLELDEGLERLAKQNDRQARIVELRFFGGLTVEETARVVGVAPKTVERDWHMARIWLRRAMRAS
jgi:RNA polymerase sigma factor (TIGR02999 family)